MIRLQQFVFTTLFLLSCTNIQAQNMYTLDGFVQESGSGERIIGASIRHPESQTGMLTNAYGFFSVELPSDTLELEVSFIGYETQKLKLYLDKDSSILIELKSNSTQLYEVEVNGYRQRPQTQILIQKEIESIPALLGEPDAMRAIQNLPGVQGGVEGFSGIHVRGGSPDQNLILLDGAQVYNASHLFGMFSVFNSDIVKSVELTKGNFPARFGGRLSSVLEVNLKEGNNQEFAGGGSIGLISSKFFVEGPIVKEKMSFVFSARRTYFDLLTSILGDDVLPFNYFYDDFNLKLNYRISTKDNLYLSTYTGHDKYGSMNLFAEGGESVEMEWRNITSIIRWNRLYSNRLFGNLSAHYTRYVLTANQLRSGNIDGEDYMLSASNESAIADLGLSYVFDHRINTNHKLNYGLHYLMHHVSPSISQFAESVDNPNLIEASKVNNRILGHEASVFAEDSWRVSHRLSLDLGLHYSVYHTGKVTYDLLQPRFGAMYSLSDVWSLNASYSSMNQYVHMLTNLGFGLPADLWVASTDKIRPQQSHQWTVGTLYRIESLKSDLRLEGYYKTMSDLITYKEGIGYSYRTNWEDLLETGGKGWTYGFELSAERRAGRFSGSANYTLSWSNRQFDAVNNGKAYPYRYDRRHMISVLGSYAFSEKFSLNASWTFMSGQAFTTPLSVIGLSSVYGGTSPYYEYSDRNALRFPNYHRFDIGVQFRKKTSWGERTWSISVYNAYNRINPFYLLPGENEDTGQTELRVYGLFPIIPSFQYSFKF
ncbi:MAG: TonB-dependent receptor [Bacteroidetes bacterium]|nr:MAG: TonB-dependent receptor [Bacteroidota bacterium]